MLKLADLGLPRADAASREEVAAATRGAEQAVPGNVLHAGGLLQDATLARQTPALARAVFAPKHAGAANLLRVRAAPSLSWRPLSPACLARHPHPDCVRARALIVCDMASSSGLCAHMRPGSLAWHHRPKQLPPVSRPLQRARPAPPGGAEAGVGWAGVPERAAGGLPAVQQRGCTHRATWLCLLRRG